VFREGSLVASAPRADWTKRLVVERMLGGESAYRAAQLLRDPDNGATMRRNNRPAKSDSALVQVEGLGVPGTLEAIDLELRSGEILGIGGLVGSGRSTVLRALAGYEPSARGRIWVGGREHSWPRTVTASRRLGIAMIPEDRRSLGLFHGLTSVDNVIVSDFGKASWHGVLGTSKSRNLAAQALTDFEFRDDWLRRPAGNLSGGNQQKLLLARWRHDPPIVLLADEPTRGIDLAAKSTVLATLGQMADGGMAIVFVSSELEEVVYVSERIIVLAQGRKVADVDNDDSQSPVTILHLAFGTDADQPGMAHDHAV
jgi:rhamnose transport system ATP-binding protein